MAEASELMSYQRVFVCCRGKEPLLHHGTKVFGLQDIDIDSYQQQHQQEEEDLRHLEEDQHVDVGCSGRLKQILRIGRENARTGTGDGGGDQRSWIAKLVSKLQHRRGNKVQPKESPAGRIFGADQFSFQTESSSSSFGLEALNADENAEFFTRIGNDSIWKERFKSLSFDKKKASETKSAAAAREEEGQDPSAKGASSLWQRRMLTPIPVLNICR